MEYLELYLLFVKIGFVSFGGGATILPFLERDLVEKRGWISEEELIDYLALSRCTPGVVAVNISTFIGYKKGGVPGALIATLGEVTSPIILICLIVAFLSGYKDLPAVRNAFAGIEVSVIVLILNTLITLLRKSVVDRLTLILFIIIYLTGMLTTVSPVYTVLAAAATGVARQVLTARKNGESHA